ncbi:acyl carrier protein [Helicobacter sp. 13S00477-4]|uniref:acyl carrier protein n=1 Tax=Helicobacter sp. 13S00477-4 TaxID=1905759 RepID=UPI000BA63323|nr:acyl carrier protein [Helicobacter sp. 13S00477-4]PAF50231.1 acyl carrier protein [Helicobacter sp. 13S00477-4]
MSIEKFESILKDCGLDKKEFSLLVGMNYNSVVNWNRTDSTPVWVASWLENYQKAKCYDELKKKVYEIEKMSL